MRLSMIPLKRLVSLWIVILLVSLAVIPATSYAQTASQILVNYPELTDVNDALQLGVYFNLTDDSGKVVTNAQVKSAKLLLDDGKTYDTTVEQPKTPFYIVLVLDASGSMSGAAEDMRQAAIQAIKDAPDQAQFAVIRFNDKIDLLQDFTADRNRAINAIGDVVPVNLAGTCLYDATYQAIQMIKDSAPQGRRAIILFTDGKDETAQGKACSRHVLDDVVQFANKRDSRVPISTIGLSYAVAEINATELRNMASSTGGLSAIGDQQALKTLFQEIMDALKSQWLSKTLIYPMHGKHTATLTITLEDGTSLSALVNFEALRDYQTPITPSPTATPIIVSLDIQAVTADLNKDVITLDIAVQGEQVIGEYRFSFFDSDTNQLLDRYSLPAPLSPPVTIPATNLRGKIRVELRIVDRQGQPISWSTGRDQTTDKAVYDFSYIRPTPTPLPASVTPVPIAVVLNSISYSQDTNTITLDLSLTGKEKMGSLEVTILDGDTNLLVNRYNFAPAESIDLAAEGLKPLKKYVIFVTAQGPSGENLSRSSQQEFTYSPLLTPTPTYTPTPPPTATQKPPQASISSINLDETTNEFIFGILTGDQDRIASYELQISDKNSGLEVGKYDRTPPPYDTIRVPLGNLPPGSYTVTLRAFAADGSLLIESSPLEFTYSPPPTATPIPTATPSPTPTPTPAPGFTKRVTNAVHDNPVLALVVVLIGFALAVVLLIVLRPRKKQSTGTGFLSSQTGFYQMPQGGEAAPSKAAPKAAARPVESKPEVKPEAATLMETKMEAEATNVYSEAFPPQAVLVINHSPASTRLGPSVAISTFPFKIGRGSQEKNDLSLDEDTSVSRAHAIITYQSGQMYVTDLGSSNGTTVNDVRLAPQTPVPVYDGTHIIFGKGSDVTLKLPGGPQAPGHGPDVDPDKTDYVNISQLR